ncbi:MmgE/PrpD family protein [Parvibaculum sp.]|uniref:MmgE/PrpD family protein n=1 Tax=Parvibaculum sp. TaxID=2024848 RepID=UPI00273130EA|nr:MmgE/PrpD family protein [Parvibaculum sp.]MDP1628040.1 MmgE/PrpD family protein [Parvibaculum sp.]MDP2151039.1 MmgE/PrpD family protein [Parvibaculum sp.]MDP3328506.1 MmgE/PrpD family protein [Parvibaculum sp.]
MNHLTTPATRPDSLTAALVRLIREKPVAKADLEAAALFTLDAVANSLAGRNSDPGRILLNWWQASASSNVAPEPERFAFLMGALCHILETDDLHRMSVVHPGCVVVPAAWALALKRKAGGRALLTAILHGFEAATRVGMAVGPAHYRIWHNTATCGPFGAAMAAGELLGLNDEATVDALGNAGSQSSGLWQFLETGAMTKHLHAGHAAQAGVKAAELAAFGFTGPPRILEGEKGFFRAACPDADPDAVTRNPGAPWQLTLTSIKPWPSCRHTHPSIDAGEELRARLLADGIAPERIAQVDVSTYQAALDVCDRSVVLSDYEAKFSLQHAVAASLLYPRVDFEAFGPAARAYCAALAARIRVNAADPWASAYPTAWGGRVSLRLDNGTEYVAERTHAKGDPEAALSRDELIAKAEMLLRHGGVDEPRRIIDGVLGMAADGPLPDLDMV